MQMFDGAHAAALFDGRPDFVVRASRPAGPAWLRRERERQQPPGQVDCIDNIDTKLELLQFCIEHEIEVSRPFRLPGACNGIPRPPCSGHP